MDVAALIEQIDCSRIYLKPDMWLKPDTLVFLDIDGVLNSEDWYVRRNTMIEAGERPCYSKLMGKWDDRDHLDPEAVQRLNRLCWDTNARVVVSSTKRHGETIEALQAMLDESGFTGEVIGKTGDRGPEEAGTAPLGQRGYEIQHWLDTYASHASFVILDDDGDMAHLQCRWVWTPNWIGLQDHHVVIATRALLSGCSTQTTRMAAARAKLVRIKGFGPRSEANRCRIWGLIEAEQHRLAMSLA